MRGISFCIHLLLISITPTVYASSCSVESWREWTQCRGTCIRAIKIRNRHVIAPRIISGEPQNDVPCPHLYEIKNCVIDQCEAGFNVTDTGDSVFLHSDQACKMSDWEDWGRCSGDCPNGWQVRNRQVIHPRISIVAELRNPCSHMYEVRECTCARTPIIDFGTLGQISEMPERPMSPPTTSVVAPTTQPPTGGRVTQSSSRNGVTTTEPIGSTFFGGNSPAFSQPGIKIDASANAPPLANRKVSNVVRTNRTKLFGKAFTMNQLEALLQSKNGFVQAIELNPEDFEPIKAKVPFSIIERRLSGSGEINSNSPNVPIVVQTMVADMGMQKVMAAGPMIPNVDKVAQTKTSILELGPTLITGSLSEVGANEEIRKLMVASAGEIRFEGDEFNKEGKPIPIPNPAPSNAIESQSLRDLMHIEAVHDRQITIGPGILLKQLRSETAAPVVAVVVESGGPVTGTDEEFFKALRENALICKVSNWLPWSSCFGNCSIAWEVRERFVTRYPPKSALFNQNCPHLFEVRICLPQNCTMDDMISAESDLLDKNITEEALLMAAFQSEEYDPLKPKLPLSLTFKKQDIAAGGIISETVLEGFLLDSTMQVREKGEVAPPIPGIALHIAELLSLNGTQMDSDFLDTNGTVPVMEGSGEGSGEAPITIEATAMNIRSPTEIKGNKPIEEFIIGKVIEPSIFHAAAPKLPLDEPTTIKPIIVNDVIGDVITESAILEPLQVEGETVHIMGANWRDKTTSTTVPVTTTLTPTTTSQTTTRNSIGSGLIFVDPVERDVQKPICRKVPFKSSCPDGSRSQPVVRWYRLADIADCASYLYSYCGRELEKLDKPIKFEEDCVDLCFNERERQVARSIN